ncbi:hypothetical protein LTLLF_139575, partial [Microtus ochrogaster]
EPRRLLLPFSPSQHLPGDTARRAPPPAEAASRSATLRPPQAPGSASARPSNPGFELGRCPRSVRAAGDSIYWAGTARAALCAVTRAHCPNPTHRPSAERRIAARAGSRAQIALRGPDFSRGFRPLVPTPREFSNSPC